MFRHNFIFWKMLNQTSKTEEQWNTKKRSMLDYIRRTFFMKNIILILFFYRAGSKSNVALESTNFFREICMYICVELGLGCHVRSFSHLNFPSYYQGEQNIPATTHELQ